MAIKILSDSACDLPEDIVKEYDIDIVPIMVIKDDKEYLDNITIKPEEVYNGMKNGEVYKTAQIPPNTFTEKFLEYAKNGDSVIYVAFSSGLSGTYQTSIFVKGTILEEYPEFDLDIVDTKAATGGFGLMVLKAAQMAKEGKSKEEILSLLDFYAAHMEHIFTVDNIEYLFRGGRVTKTQAFLGGLLNIKPVLNMEDGKLVPLEKARGSNKAYKIMMDIIGERGKDADLENQIIGISHGDDLELALKVKEMLTKSFGTTNFLINTIGAAIGAHSGPGTIAITFLNKKY
ncbi:DegV family protein [Tissierella sp.]|uniref:DegV family protein n=1 Tax=Tissierella sp. TaxID=41274 RepID=UPI002863E3A4|nr:DegV family protein [Tissierella sp.]MDR7857750.1 DegV family protein [Tissierella sp.]